MKRICCKPVDGRNTTTRIEILVFPGVDELDALGPLEVLRNAQAFGAKFETRIVTVEDHQEITGSHRLRFRPDALLAADGRPDVLVVPGGGWNTRSAEGAWNAAQLGVIPRAIARLHGEGAILASVCTGAMLVAAAGLANNRHLTTHHQTLAELRAVGARVVEARVVDDGDIISASGVTSGLDLGLYLVERFANGEVARKVAREMEYERRDPVWKQAERDT
jgi:transcriptional regulator GlxA family with amidase domain